ncbi:hypothetical protein EDD18DRAFT_1103797 [Armillaria luteobubalina]|uniref:Uncharacterized protein n=1 Tax=Armillaria luteobubalina TaxID=153913 RepID=A0AA39Q8G8_9AGAR|nr:hypothetical protein EDD18DRAFT_1103797 [Armillaria luteobubalina]
MRDECQGEEAMIKATEAEEETLSIMGEVVAVYMEVNTGIRLKRDRIPTILAVQTGMVMVSATAQSGDNPATDYHPTNDSGEQGLNWDSEHEPRDMEWNPGSQSMSHPQNAGQPNHWAEPRAGLAYQSKSHPTREMANERMLEMVKNRLNMGPLIGAHIVAGTQLNGRCMRCSKHTKASIKITALNIYGMGNTNTWHPDNKWNHVNQIM